MPFKKLHKLLQKIRQGRPPQPHEVQWLGSLPVRYPEVDTVEYEPRSRMVTLNFVLKCPLNKVALALYDGQLRESYAAYRHLEGRVPAEEAFQITADVVEEVSRVHVELPLQNLTSDEVDLIIDVAVQTYGEDLAVDHQMDSLLDDTFIQQQEDMFAMLLVEMQQHPPRVALAGYRDEGHVIVYNR